MNQRTTLLSLLLLSMPLTVSAQSLPMGPSSAQVAPLNLSMPKKAAQDKSIVTATDKSDGLTTGQGESVETTGKKNEESSVVRLPYGAGFENRQQSMGSGGGGRGGKGRGR